jgi:serine protease
VVDGIRWAAGLPVSGVPTNPNPARVINVSFGGAGSCGVSYQTAIDAARAVRSLVVVAAGNESGPLTRPADCRGVLSVGAVRQDGLKTWYSNFGRSLGIMVPGGAGAQDGGPALYSTLNSGQRGPETSTYGAKQGTSFAAPLAAGVAALMLAANSALGPDEIISRIQSGARPFPHVPGHVSCESAATINTPCNCTAASCGPGLLDAAGALQLAASPSVAIAPVDAVDPGATVTLDGRGSTPSQGAQLVGYQWSQYAGPSNAAIATPDQAMTSVTLPGGQGSWVFRLVVTDSAGRSADNYVTVATRDAGDSDSGGGGAMAWWWGLGLWLAAIAAWRQRRSQPES